MTTTNLCRCGCGLPARPGKPFHKYHNLSASGRAMRWTGGKYEYHYRLVMEQALGRKLLPGECVHHKNEDCSDDRIENLQLCATNAEHIRNHHPGHKAVFTCHVCGRECRRDRRNRVQRHFCGRECFLKWRGEGKGGWTDGRNAIRRHTCTTCGREFEGKRPNQASFCSRECYRTHLKTNAPARRSDSVQWNGELRTVASLAREFGHRPATIHSRLDRGWSLERALSQPLDPRGRR